MKVLVVYDIANPRRLNRVAKVMKNWGIRVQKSVFEVETGKRQILMLVREIETLLVSEEDSVKFFRLCEKCKVNISCLGLGGLIEEHRCVII